MSTAPTRIPRCLCAHGHHMPWCPELERPARVTPQAIPPLPEVLRREVLDGSGGWQGEDGG